jgi:dihydrolipoamide dehydrogenase
MKPAEMPKSLIVVGSGAIGIEFASFYRSLGAEVTVVEMMSRVVPAEDEEISTLARKAFEKQGMKILTDSRIEKVDVSGPGVEATVMGSDGTQHVLNAEKLILAAGVVANTEGLGIEAIGVDLHNGVIATDGAGRTSVPGIWAIGDVAGPPMLAHKAEHEGVICVETIGGLAAKPLASESIPACTYCNPQIASIGLTEAKAKELGREVKIGRFPFAGNGKALAMGETQGLIKTIVDAQTRSDCRRSLDRSRSHRAHPRLFDRHCDGCEGLRPHAHGIPASHAFRDDPRKRPGN